MRRRRISRLWTWWNAFLDRRRDLPSPNATALSEAEQQIRSATNVSIREIEHEYVQKAKPLEAALLEKRQLRSQMYEPEYERLSQVAGRRDLLICFSRSVHWLLLGLLTVGEMAFNMIVFNIFHEPTVLTAICALGVMIAVPTCAFHVGLSFRQSDRPWLRSLPAALTLVVVLVAISWFRLNYLQQTTASLIDPFYWQLGFSAINLVVLVGASLVTYLAHDPLEGFCEAKQKLDRLNAETHRIAGYLSKLAAGSAARVEIAKESGWQLLAYYRAVNRRGRRQVPRYYDDEEHNNHRPAFIDLAIDHRLAVRQQ